MFRTLLLTACLMITGCGYRIVPVTPTPQPEPKVDDDFLNGWKTKAPASVQVQAPAPAPAPVPIIVKVEIPKIEVPAPKIIEVPQAPKAAAFPPFPPSGPASGFPPKAPPAELYAEMSTQDVPAHWNGAVVYHASWCKWCPQLIADLKSRAVAAGWKVGTTNDCHFKLVDIDTRQVNFPQVDQVPTVVYFWDGVEKGRIVGYSGQVEELNAILAKHPKSKRTGLTANPAGNTTFELGAPAIVEEPYMVPAMAAPAPVFAPAPVCIGPACGLRIGVGFGGCR